MVHGRRGQKPLKNRRERTADAILAVSAALAAGAAFLPPSAGSGLLFHTALAAAVGGAADWFAVNSLFRRPLGIPFRTELVPRSRDKIIRMARAMIAEEILTVPRIYRVLKTHSLSGAIQPWLAQHRDMVRELLRRLLLEGMEQLDKERLSQKAADAAGRTAESIDWAALLHRALLEAETEERRPRLLRGIRNAAQAFLKDGLTDTEILDLYHRAWETYERDGMGRGMLRSLLQGQLGLTDEKAAALIQEKIMDWAHTLGDPDSEAGRRLLEKYRAFLERLGSDAPYRKRFNEAAGAFLLPLLREKGADWILGLLESRQETAAGEAADRLLRLAERSLADASSRKQIDRFLLGQIVQYLPAIQQAIGDSAERALSAYSGREMAELIETNVWHDLQMIRVNGSLMGAVLGALSYAAFYGMSGGALL